MTTTRRCTLLITTALAAVALAPTGCRAAAGTGAESARQGATTRSPRRRLARADAGGRLPFAVVDTGQEACFDARSSIPCPAAWQPFSGQDAQHAGSAPRYADNGDGTVTDEVTGLMWTATPDLDGDGVVDAADTRTWAEALAGAADLTLAGHRDWRLPTIKELYSLIDFRGTDPSGDVDAADLVPFLDTSVFGFGYGDAAAGARVIDAQFATSTSYVSTTMHGNATMFGVNFADGRIKGYPSGATPRDPGGKGFYVLYVRGDGRYGVNELTDNGDGTVSDRATGLMWAKADSGHGMDWQSALAWAAARNAEGYLGYGDWRLPDAKELQSIVDYSRSPDTTGSAAIDPVFDVTPVANEAGQVDFPWFWTGTTHAAADGSGRAAVYVAFGRALGWMKADPWASCLTLMDVHGAGAQRSDPKSGTVESYPLGASCDGGLAYGRGPQGDVVRIDNFVRLVRAGGSGS